MGAEAAISGEGRLRAVVAYLFLWVGGAIILLTSTRERKYERWHAVQAVAFALVWTAFMIPALLAGTGALGPPPGNNDFQWIGFLLSMLGVLFIVTWLALMVVAGVGRKLRLPGVARLADRYA